MAVGVKLAAFSIVIFHHEDTKTIKESAMFFSATLCSGGQYFYLFSEALCILNTNLIKSICKNSGKIYLNSELCA
jgi:hypothetical protein